jgi:hypothetical protein
MFLLRLFSTLSQMAKAQIDTSLKIFASTKREQKFAM